jgi:hypothetical protein
MSREIAIRIPSEIGDWVRQKPGSTTETVLALAGDLYKRREYVTLADPGPGDDRLKIRLQPRALQFIRAVTHSRNGTAALRKLLLWGYERRALPAAPSRRVLSASATVTAPISVPRLSAGGENWEGVYIPAGAIPAHPSRAMALASWHEGANVSNLPASERPPTLGEIMLHGVLPLAGLVLLLFGKPIFNWLFGGKLAAVGAMTAKAVPSVAAWTPQAATGLGALFL